MQLDPLKTSQTTTLREMERKRKKGQEGKRSVNGSVKTEEIKLRTAIKMKMTMMMIKRRTKTGSGERDVKKDLKTSEGKRSKDLINNMSSGLQFYFQSHKTQR